MPDLTAAELRRRAVREYLSVVITPAEAERCARALEALEREEAAERRRVCPECNGAGYVESRPIIYETDSLEEINDAFMMARRPCKSCSTIQDKADNTSGQVKD